MLLDKKFLTAPDTHSQQVGLYDLQQIMQLTRGVLEVRGYVRRLDAKRIARNTYVLRLRPLEKK